ncbi:MAG TPA: DUF2169 domain-containing protein, partial [Opitutaceae bacterium]
MNVSVPYQQENPAGRVIQKIALPSQTPQGQHMFKILVKRTYAIISGRRCTRAAAGDRKLIPDDVHYDDPMNSTVRYESDFVPFKLATDVVLNGRAYAPSGQRVDTLTVSLIVGPHRKDLFVIGDRVARFHDKHDSIFTEPRPFEAMELRYERAYGGVDVYSEPKMQCVYPRNHLGRGYAVANKQRAIDDLPLPNIEDPDDRLTPARLCAGSFKNWERMPAPQGLGWTMKMWHPRSSYAGVMPADRALEQELRRAYATLVPPSQRKAYDQTQLPNMDFRFFNGASSGLVLTYLSGDEQVRLLNLDPRGEIRFQLPGERPKIGLDLGHGVEEPQVVLHTVMIRMEDREVDLVWRGAVPYPGPDWLPEMKRMDVLVE